MTSSETTVALHSAPSAAPPYDPDAYDICRPTIPPPANETDAERIARIEREFEQLRDCVNAELKVRAETSLLAIILLKLVLPFTAIAAGFSTVYIAVLRASNTEGDRTELFLGLGYAILAAGAILLWRSFRKPGSGGRGDAMDRSIRNVLKLSVPPSKEKLTRNRYVNRWILFWLTWGLILGLPLIFFLFRADALERAGLKLVFDTADICAPTVGGYNPYEGSDVCADSGYTYASSADASTGSGTGVGSESGLDSLTIVPPRTESEVNVAEVRLDVTTTLVLYFLILIVGILVSMIRWWRADRKRMALPPANAPPGAAPESA
ncbi:MAG: hypothetical protein KC438_05960 [Thermomicrobiales bacterium]|nr:hypothetical protein [Thermomicrobiales bacterium]MCO5220751.1 hypothetical protein [Thermomicrobiales bacterium]